jgi:hypothetical protein
MKDCMMITSEEYWPFQKQASSSSPVTESVATKKQVTIPPLYAFFQQNQKKISDFCTKNVVGLDSNEKEQTLHTILKLPEEEDRRKLQETLVCDELLWEEFRTEEYQRNGTQFHFVAMKENHL